MHSYQKRTGGVSVRWSKSRLHVNVVVAAIHCEQHVLFLDWLENKHNEAVPEDVDHDGVQVECQGKHVQMTRSPKLLE